MKLFSRSSTLKGAALLLVCFFTTLADGEISSDRLLYALQQRSVLPDGTVVLRAGEDSGPNIPSRRDLPPPTYAIDTALEAKIEEILNSSPYDRAQWGIEVLSLDDNQIVYAHNSRRPMIPASNMKLFTTATAMHYLGAQYRFKTAVYGQSHPTAEGALPGNLMLRGGGDPFFTRDSLKDGALSFFEDIAQQLRGKGVRRIGGNIIGDDSLYPYNPPATSALASPQTLHEEGQAKVTPAGEPEDDQEGEVSALSFYDNTVGIRVIPTRSGAPVIVHTEPSTNYFQIINRATATRGRRSRLRVAKSRGSNTIVLTGKVSLRSRGLLTYVRVDDPAAFGAYLLKESLERNGIAVSGIAESHHGGAIPYREMHELAKHESPPLIDAISIINKRSINPYAELLLRLIGSEVRGRSTADAGISVVQEYVRQTGVDPNELSINDGSGLSKANALSPHAEISLLRYVTLQNYYPSFVSSLAVAGTDGTLRNRLSNGATVQRIFGKTGTLANVVALGGFLYSLQGKRLAFVIFCNNFVYGAGSARHAVDQIVEVLARHDYGSSGNSPANLSGAQGNGKFEPFDAITRPIALERLYQTD